MKRVPLGELGSKRDGVDRYPAEVYHGPKCPRPLVVIYIREADRSVCYQIDSALDAGCRVVVVSDEVPWEISTRVGLFTDDPNVSVLARDQPLGAAAAINDAISSGGEKIIVWLARSAVPAPGWIQSAARAIELGEVAALAAVKGSHSNQSGSFAEIDAICFARTHASLVDQALLISIGSSFSAAAIPVSIDEDALVEGPRAMTPLEALLQLVERTWALRASDRGRPPKVAPGELMDHPGWPELTNQRRRALIASLQEIGDVGNLTEFYNDLDRFDADRDRLGGAIIAAILSDARGGQGRSHSGRENDYSSTAAV